MPYHFIVEASNISNPDEKRYIWLHQKSGNYVISNDKPDNIIEKTYLYYLLLDQLIPESLYTYSKEELSPNSRILTYEELAREGVIYDKMLLKFRLLTKSHL